MLRRTDHPKQVFRHTPDDGRPPGPLTLLSIVGDSAKLEGKFEIAGSLQIDCEVRGELKVGGKLVIGESGVVHADVEILDAVIHGKYQGNMVATGDVEIGPTGRVSGNIKTDSLMISKGALFIGNVTKIGEPGRRGGVVGQGRRSLRAKGSHGPQGAPVRGSVDALIAEIRDHAVQEGRAKQQ